MVHPVAGWSTNASAEARSALRRIADGDSELGAWVSTIDAHALDVSPPLGTSADGPLKGVPVGVKDVIDTHDLPTERGSSLFASRQSRLDATIVALLRRAGAIVVGKTVTAEFGLFHPNGTRNPHDPARTPGGSSSGSAAAVGAGHVPLTVGTQTGGSIIRPASYCGAWAIKPTFGSIDRAGMMLHAPSVDTLGFLASSSEMLARALRATCWPSVVRRGTDRPGRQQARHTTVTFAEVHNLGDLDADAARRIEAAATLLDTMPDVEVRRETTPFDGAAVDEAAGIVVAFEAFEGLSPLIEEHPDEVSSEIHAIVVRGSGIDRAAYHEAMAVGHDAAERTDRWLTERGLVVTPSAPGVAPAGLSSTGSSAFNRTWSFLGQPCVGVPALRGSHDLPLGLQLIGARGADFSLLRGASLVHHLLAPLRVDESDR